MIHNSFIFLPKISHKTEQNIWQQGITEWDTFLNSKTVKGLSPLRKGFYDRQLMQAKKELFNNNTNYFTALWPSTETWRMYNSFKDETCYLDIETCGTAITIIGLYDGYDTKIMVRGINLDFKFLGQFLQRFKLIVSFNGSSFDLPMIEKYCPGTIPKVPHIDLRHCCARLGLNGGLKNIEKILGIQRIDDVVTMQGMDAVYLWQMWKSTGDREYLDKLIRYNEEDIINLKPIMEKVYRDLKEKILTQPKVELVQVLF